MKISQSNSKSISLERPKVGVGVLIIKGNQILLGKRKNAHGHGTWSPPGGHLEFGETFQECAKREVLEETGLTLFDVHQYSITNDIFLPEEKHYITIFMLSRSFSGIPHVLEPDKCECWQWFNLNALPDNLFLPMQNLLKQEQITVISNKFLKQGVKEL